MPPDTRPAVLREPAFRRFFLGYATSLLGSSMASIAVSFAVLDSGGGGAELGYVLAARTLPLVLVLLAGGVVSDRLGSRRAMLTADAVRCLTQAGLAVVLVGGAPPVGALAALVAVWGMAEALFTPGLNALIPHVARAEALNDANALLGMAGSAAAVAGPVLSGILTATAGPSLVLALDAASYAVSVAVLLPLPQPVRPVRPASSFVTDLRDGWTEFRSHTWLWVMSLHGCAFNLLVWAPFLVLGPVVAERRLGGAGAWGVTMALYGVGAVLGGTAAIGRDPGRPLLVAAIACLGYALPSAALATGLALPWVGAAAFAAGVGSSVSATFEATTTQRRVAPGTLARVSAYNTFGAFALGPVGLAAAGPVSLAVGTSGVLGFGAVWQTVTALAVLAVPAVRGAFPRPSPAAGPVRALPPPEPPAV